MGLGYKVASDATRFKELEGIEALRAATGMHNHDVATIATSGKVVTYVYDASNAATDDGVTVIGGWTLDSVYAVVEGELIDSVGSKGTAGQKAVANGDGTWSWTTVV